MRLDTHHQQVYVFCVNQKENGGLAKTSRCQRLDAWCVQHGRGLFICLAVELFILFAVALLEKKCFTGSVVFVLAVSAAAAAFFYHPKPSNQK